MTDPEKEKTRAKIASLAAKVLTSKSATNDQKAIAGGALTQKSQAMPDIVERLRRLAEENYEILSNIHVPLSEAAAEIEKLRESLSKARADAIEEAACLVERLGTRKSLHIRIQGVFDENPGQIEDLGKMRVDELHQKIAAAIRAHSATTTIE